MSDHGWRVPDVEGDAVAHWSWIERRFDFDFPAAKWPDLLERVRGTPARLEERMRDVPARVLTLRERKRWSIQQNIGHLIDLGYLPLRRMEQILGGEEVLLAADMSNRKTNQADHNRRDIKELLDEFRAERKRLVSRFESLEEGDWSKSALHPRLGQPMRIVDIAYFDSEHDDYHLARIGALIRSLTG